MWLQLDATIACYVCGNQAVGANSFLLTGLSVVCRIEKRKNGADHV
jgi:hypothetical protein